MEVFAGRVPWRPGRGAAGLGESESGGDNSGYANSGGVGEKWRGLNWDRERD